MLLVFLNFSGSSGVRLGHVVQVYCSRGFVHKNCCCQQSTVFFLAFYTHARHFLGKIMSCFHCTNYLKMAQITLFSVGRASVHNYCLVSTFLSSVVCLPLPLYLHKDTTMEYQLVCMYIHKGIYWYSIYIGAQVNQPKEFRWNKEFHLIN